MSTCILFPICAKAGDYQIASTDRFYPVCEAHLQRLILRLHALGFDVVWIDPEGVIHDSPSDATATRLGPA